MSSPLPISWIFDIAGHTVKHGIFSSLLFSLFCRTSEPRGGMQKCFEILFTRRGAGMVSFFLDWKERAVSAMSCLAVTVQVSRQFKPSEMMGRATYTMIGSNRCNRKERISIDSSSDRIKDIPSLFPCCGEVTSDASKMLRSFDGTKTARYFQANLDHTNILFGKIVREWYM